MRNNNYDPKDAIDYVKSCSKNGWFDAITFITKVTRENTIWLYGLERILISCNVFRVGDSAYTFKKNLWSEMKAKIEFVDEKFDFDYLNEIAFEDLNDKTHNYNLLSAIIDYIKQKIEGLIKDIDEYVLDDVIKILEKELGGYDNE